VPVVRAGIALLAALADGTSVFAEYKGPLPPPQGGSRINLAQVDAVVRNFGLVNDFCLGVGLAYSPGQRAPAGRSPAAAREDYPPWLKSWGGQWHVTGIV